MAKPDPGHLTRILPDLPRDARAAVVVGDSAVGVAAARAAGLPVIVVDWGYARGSAAGLQGDAVAESFSQVPSLVKELSQRIAQA